MFSEESSSLEPTVLETILASSLQFATHARTPNSYTSPIYSTHARTLNSCTFPIFTHQVL